MGQHSRSLHGKHDEPRLRLPVRCLGLDPDGGRVRGDKIGSIIGHDLDGVFARRECNRMLELELRDAGRCVRLIHADRNAIYSLSRDTMSAYGGRRPTRQDLAEVELGRRLLHLTIQVTGELFAHQIRAEERLIHLFDREDP